MHCADDRRHLRTSLRGVAVALAGPLLLILALGGCTPEPPEEEPSPTVADGTPSSADPSPTGPATPSDGPGAADDPSTAPSPTDPPLAADEPEADPTTGWQAPQDPMAEGPTAAPDLPEVHGSMDEGIALPTNMVVSLDSVTTTTLAAETPGEYAGPAVVLTVHVTNGSSEAQRIDSAVISLVADDGEMGIPTWASPYAPLVGEVAPGETAEGTYVFMLDPAPGRAVTVSVNYSAGEPLAVFTGQTS